jgi:imidazolonepropionase-like amidohydrolase
MNEKTAITNVRVFDGDRLSEPRTVVVDGAVIGTDAAGATVFDAAGATLLPGLVDAHVHLHGPETLDKLARHGVTTALDMATWPRELVDSLRAVPGRTDIRSAGLPAIGPAGPHSHFGMPDGAVLFDPAQAPEMVAARIAAGSDYLKIVLEEPGAGGPDPAPAASYAAAAHAQGKKLVAHAAAPGAFTLALDIAADVVTHIPLGAPLDESIVRRLAAAGTIAVPTLTMMRGLATAFGKPQAFAGALRSVALLHAAGVPILAGTDANTTPGSPSPVEHGASLHQELDLLVQAGLRPVEALRAATVLPARHFDLPDRGAVRPGLRADLLLIDGDPLTDITATTKIVRVWCAGSVQP